VFEGSLEYDKVKEKALGKEDWKKILSSPAASLIILTSCYY